MKLCKATIYYFDINSNDNPTSTLKYHLDNSRYMSHKLFDIKEIEIGEWYDGIDLNKTITANKKETYENYFDNSRKKLFTIMEWTLEIMKTSHITGTTIDEAVDIACKKYLKDNNGDGKPVTLLMEGHVDWIKNRCEQILKEQ